MLVTIMFVFFFTFLAGGKLIAFLAAFYWFMNIHSFT